MYYNIAESSIAYCVVIVTNQNSGWITLCVM